ncbi:MAG: hypothetical protein KatS3mg115_0063 [Candidatus Poribacteria bacterium]|nr:MAG: hypothetical protein KatS3mg115_0063 [Candidatus Poribacteria bacterium]
MGSLVGGLLGIALASALYHLALIVLGGRNAPYRATFRAIAYVNGAMAWIAWIPVLGWLGAWIWGIVLEVLALREVHRTTTGRAVVAVLAPLLVMLLVLGLLAALVLKLFLETKEKSPGLI